MLSDDQRRRLEQEKDDLEQQYQLQFDQIAAIRRALIPEVDPGRRFQLEHQIDEREKVLRSINDRLNTIENLLLEPKDPPIEPPKDSTKIADFDPTTQPVKSINQLFKLPLSFLPWFFLAGSLGGGILWFLLQSMKPSILDLCREDYPLISCKSSNSTIDKNNKEILSKIGKTLNKDRVHAIAVVVPGSNARPFISQDILEGVAKKQDEFNNAHVDRQIFVVIAHEAENSRGEPDGGLKIAKKLVEQKLILGVVGPYSSSSVAHVVNTYCKNNLVVVSPTATTPINDITRMIIANHLESDLKSEKDIKLECFFRIPETNDKAVESLVGYLVKEQYKRVLVLSTDGDASSISFQKNLIHKIGRKTEIDLDEKDKQQLNVSNPNIEINKKIEKWKGKYKSQTGKTAIFVIEGGKYSSLEDTLAVIQTNNGNFLILGNNPVYDPELLNKLSDKQRGLTEDSIRKIIIAVPSFTSFTPKSVKNLTWYESMSSYATQLLINSINKEFKKSGSVERDGVTSQFNNVNNEIFNIEASTKIIKLKSDSLENTSYDLIQPNCSTRPCKWEKINLDDKPKQKSAP